jgi:hypothetical protein
MKVPPLPGLLALCALVVAPVASRAAPNFTDTIARPLHFQPKDGAFVVENGREFFNRPLYGPNTAFRVDAGDQPEFALYLPGCGGNLRLGIQTPGGAKWLFDADKVVARYGDGVMRYEISDRLLGNGRITVTAAAMSSTEGLLVRVERSKATGACELIAAYGGVSGKRGARGGDIGCESEPVSRFFQLKPEACAGNAFEVAGAGFRLRGKAAEIVGVLPAGAQCTVVDAKKWASIEDLLAGSDPATKTPIVVARMALAPGRPACLALQRLSESGGRLPAFASTDLPKIFEQAARHGAEVSHQVAVETPDSFINAAVPALCLAANGIWDSRQKAFMHGAVAWRTKLLGWRGAGAGDELGWHDRTRDHLMNWFPRQNTQPVPVGISGEPARVPPDERVRLARNEPALHSNGDLTRSHYDMNLPAIDVFFRHLLWTGDLDFARRNWSVIERHLAWERRLFRRTFGPDKLPLYEAYAAIWASDDLQYEGGGVAHASACNYFHNKMAATVAGLIGKDPAPYEKEAGLILRAMNRELWLPDRGCFAESKDLLGLQLTHPAPALWTFYHTVDSGVATPEQAWRMARYVETRMPHIPLKGPGVPEGCFTLPTTTWMPYRWSTNNVVTAEAAHTALALWQAGHDGEAFRLFKGSILDSMFMGLCPGNVGMCTQFDMARGESQRDFADGVGTVSRALVEGLFGVKPNALSGELTVQPGFPAAWDHAAMRHPDFTFAFRRVGLREDYHIASRFPHSMALRLILPAFRDDIATVTINGKAAAWRPLADSVATPRVEIRAPAAEKFDVAVTWKGRTPALAASSPAMKFATVRQGAMTWSIPGKAAVAAEASPAWPMTDWTKTPFVSGTFAIVNLVTVLNDDVTRIFQNEYRSPRSPYCSLALPLQGIGSWIQWKADGKLSSANIDDAGLRRAAGQAGGRFVLPQGIPFETPGVGGGRNIAFTSRWDNYPNEVSVALTGKASRIYLLMAGSTNAMQSRLDNGEVVVTYADGSTERLALENPTTWWPIEQDYLIDDYAFRRPQPLPLRVDLKTGKVRTLDLATFKGQGGSVDGGAATVLDFALKPDRELESLTVRALANEVVIGLMGATLLRTR